MRSVEGRCDGRYVAEGEARAVAEWLIAEVREQYREDLDRIGDELERVVHVFSVAHNVYGLQTSDAIREMRQHAQMIALVDEAIDVYGRVVTNSNVNESNESAHRRGIAAVVNALRAANHDDGGK